MKTISLVLLILSVSITMSASELNKVERVELSSGWFFKQSGLDLWNRASVPGCVHTDLMSNNIIPDPYFGINESKLQWIGQENWEYRTTFDIDDNIMNKKNIVLVFNGLDTYAGVYVNGQLILTADNMFRVWKVDCKNILKQSNNILHIKFRNVFNETIPMWEKAPYRLLAGDNNDQADTMVAMYSRKAQFHYGWDWGPRLVTCGIWRPVVIEAWDNLKINSVQVIQEHVTKEIADISCFVDVISDIEQKADIVLDIDGNEKIFAASTLKIGLNKIKLNLKIENPDLWWTTGLGTQYLYDFNFRIKSENGYTDEKSERIGIRSLEIVREKDGHGTSLFVKLNGTPVFMKGANYIPQDNFQNRVTREKYEYIIKSAAEANMNMLRVWGGGIFQDDAFYEMCDKYGILIWHDMMFACAMYPSDDHFLENVKYELIDNITRIRNHPSIALYCGNNEIQVGWNDWGWKQQYDKKNQRHYEKSMSDLYENLIPNIIRDVDPTRYYHASSPIAGWGGLGYGDGDIHYWSVWHGKAPFEKFNDNIARFISEYGFQSYPELSSVEKFTEPIDRDLHSKVMLSHQRCMADGRRDKEYGNRLIKNYMDNMYKEPKNFESYLYVSQLLQAEGIKTAIEAHRRNMPYCMGSLYWQINDCWPVASWSSIDYYGRWKALHYYAKKSFEPVHVQPRLEKGFFKFYIVSDLPEEIRLELSIYLYDFSGNQLFNKIEYLNITPNHSGVYYELSKNEILRDFDKSKVVMLAELRSEDRLVSENYFYFVPQKNMSLEKPDIKWNLIESDDGFRIELSTDKFAKNVFLSLNNADGFFSDNYFDLIPGIYKSVELVCESCVDKLAEKIKVFSLADSY